MTPRLSFVLQSALVVIGLGLVMAMLAPSDGYMGLRQKIMYIHVPQAIGMAVSLLWFTAGGAMYLGLRLPLIDHMNRACAAVALLCAGMVLITGSLWGRSAWGAYWRWDPRLTSTALMFIYLCGATLLRGSLEESNQAPVATAAMGLMGAPGYFVIHMSVNWWASLHQGATVLSPSGPKIQGLMLYAYLLNVAGWLMLFGVLLAIGTRRYHLLACLREKQEREEEEALAL